MNIIPTSDRIYHNFFPYWCLDSSQSLIAFRITPTTEAVRATNCHCQVLFWNQSKILMVQNFNKETKLWWILSKVRWSVVPSTRSFKELIICHPFLQIGGFPMTIGCKIINTDPYIVKARNTLYSVRVHMTPHSHLSQNS